MRRITASFLVAPVAALSMYACSGSNGSSGGFGPDNGDGGSQGDGSSGIGDGGFNADVASFGEGGGGHDAGSVSIIYAHTDSELYTFDPATQQVTDVGAFSGMGGGTGDNAVTDLAVNGNGDVWVNTETVVYQAAIPSSGTGAVALTKKATIATATGQKFFALAFTPPNVLGASETLVAGDNKGDLYVIDTATGQLQMLGGFGGNYQLSGDLVFYMQNGQPQGLATIRTCPNNKCTTTNDILAQIDMAALAQAFTSKAPGTLLKKVYGSGTGFGELFGVGAWQDKVYAFSRAQTNGAPAQLVAIDGNGTGSSIKTFANITKGWSGAGVTTKAAITIPPPK